MGASGQRLWVFGYGSLMWDGWEAQFDCQLRMTATLQGHRRCFNKLSVKNWGTKATPCPTLNLQEDRDGHCVGVAFSFDEIRKEDVLGYLRRREGKAFVLEPCSVLTSDGIQVTAYVPKYIGRNLLLDLAIDRQVAMIRAARGESGTGITYVNGVAEKLRQLGLRDPVVQSVVDALSVT
jgi:cation transport protein ChaC